MCTLASLGWLSCMAASTLPALESIQMTINTSSPSLYCPLLQTASGIRTYLALCMWESYVLFWLASSQNCRNDLRFPFVQYYTTLLSDCQLIITWLVHILFCGNQQAFTQYTVILGALGYDLVYCCLYSHSRLYFFSKKNYLRFIYTIRLFV